jgi:hypothetical protein
MSLTDLTRDDLSERRDSSYRAKFTVLTTRQPRHFRRQDPKQYYA